MSDDYSEYAYGNGPVREIDPSILGPKMMKYFIGSFLLFFILGFINRKYPQDEDKDKKN